MMIAEFIVTILVWLFVGLLGVVFNTKQLKRSNFPMIFFMVFMPLIPIVAKVCGLF